MPPVNWLVSLAAAALSLAAEPITSFLAWSSGRLMKDSLRAHHHPA